MKPEADVLMARKKELLRTGTSERDRIKKTVDGGKPVSSLTFETAVTRIKEDAEEFFPDDKTLRRELENANMALLEEVTSYFEQKLRGARPSEQSTSRLVETNPDPLMEQLRTTQEHLIQALGNQATTFEQLVVSSERQAEQMVRSLRKLPPDLERARWVDVEYNQDFYTRFTPTLEPNFYTELSENERELCDARWQLARAAYYKRAFSAFPDKMIENQDLTLMKTEQMEKLYEMPGVRPALEWYADLIVNKRAITLESGRTMTIWDCKTGTDFEEFRAVMRQEALHELAGGLAKKEADAVAWNWMWVANLIESADSRYFYKDGPENHQRHGDLPGALVSDDLRSTFHTQEKFENKCMSGLEWGAFGKWGMIQVSRIKQKYGSEYELFFEGADIPDHFWSLRRLKKPAFERLGKRRALKEKGLTAIVAPECYPTKTMGSFWEEFSTGRGRDAKSLLGHLLDREEIDWQAVGSDLWIPYLPIKLNKAVKLFEYFNPGVPLEFPTKFQEEGPMREWTGKLLDSLRRLNLERKLGTDKIHNLKVWAVYAAKGGVKKPQSAMVHSPLSRFDRTALESVLRMNEVAFLDKSFLGRDFGERLVIR